MKSAHIEKEEFRWSFRKKGTQVFNICTRLLLLFGFTALMTGASQAVLANPTGGTVVGGSATITNTSTGLQIDQTSENAIINWSAFNIAKGETTQFIQPNSSATALNRVFNSNQLSFIDGNLLANGHIIIINPNGVIIGKHGNINTAGFIATTADIANAAFMNNTNGTYNFNIAGSPNASVVNKGLITVQDEGLVALVAPSVRNDGVITGTLSTVQLGAADTFGVDLYGDGLISLAVGQSKKLKAVNNGTIFTPGGKVLMTAAAASSIVNSVINNTGVIEANTLENVNGQIILKAQGATTKVSGTLQAKGGSIETSGAVLNVADGTDIEAASWLLDPLNIDISHSGTTVAPSSTYTSNVTDATINKALQSNTTVTVETTGTGTGGNITLETGAAISLTGGHSATLDLDTSATTNGTVTLDGTIAASGTNKLGLTVNSASDVNVDAAVNTNGGAVSLTSNKGQVLSNASGDISTAGGGVTVKAATNVNLAGDISSGAGAVGITATSGTLTDSGGISASGTTGTVSLTGSSSIDLASNITTNGGYVVFNDAVTLGASSVISTGSGSVTFGGTVDGNHALTINGGGAVNFNYAVGGSASLSSLSVGSTGAIALNNNITTTGKVSLTGPVTLGSNDTITTTNSAVTFGSTVNGAYGLTVNSGTGMISLEGNAATSGVNLTGGSVSTQGITSAGAIAIDGGSTGTDTVNGTLKTTGTGDITLTSGTGGITTTSGGNFTAISGGSATLYSNLSTGTGLVDIEAANSISTKDITTTTGSGTKNLTGAPYSIKLTTTTGNIQTGALTAGTGAGGFSTLYASAGGTLTTGNISVSNDDNSDAPDYSQSAATLIANGNIQTGTVSVTAKDTDPDNFHSIASLTITSAAGSISTNGITVTADQDSGESGGTNGTSTATANLTASGTVTVNSGGIDVAATAENTNKTPDSSDTAEAQANASLTINASSTVEITGPVTATSDVSSPATLSTDASSATINIASTGGELYFTQNPVAHAYDSQSTTGAQATDTYVGLNYSSGTVTADSSYSTTSTTTVPVFYGFWYDPSNGATTKTDEGQSNKHPGGIYTSYCSDFLFGCGVQVSKTTTTTVTNADQSSLTLSGVHTLVVSDDFTKSYGSDDTSAKAGTTALYVDYNNPLTNTDTHTAVPDDVTVDTSDIGFTPRTVLSVEQEQVNTGTGYDITLTDSQSTVTATDGNKFNIVTGSGLLFINPIALAINPAEITKTYGDTIAFGDTTYTDTPYVGTPVTTAAELSTPLKLCYSADGLSWTDTITSVSLSSAGVAETASVISPGPSYAITASNVQITSTNDAHPLDSVTGAENNYSPSYGTAATLTIDPAILTVTADAVNKTYDGGTDDIIIDGGSEPGATVSLNGVILPGDVNNLYATGFSAQFASANVNYTLVPTFTVLNQTVTFSGISLGGTAAGNYTLAPGNTTATGQAMITPAGLTITANSTNKAYGAEDPTFGYTISSGQLYSSDSVSDTVTRSDAGTLAGEQAGDHNTITNNVTVSDDNNGYNYALTTVNGTLDITPVSLTITATSIASKTYGDTATLSYTSNPEAPITYSADGLTWTDTIDSVHLYSAGAAATANVNTYNIYAHNAQLSGTDGTTVVDATGNYNICYKKGTLTVDPLAVTLTGARTYDGTTGASYSILSVSNAVNEDDINVVSGSGTLAGKDVGTQAITGFGNLTLGNNAAGDYTLTGATGSVAISSLAVTLTGARTYDGTTGASYKILSVSNAVNEDDIDVVSGSGTLDGKDVGTQAITSFGNLTLGNNAAGDYTLTGATGSVAINPKLLIVTADNQTITQGQTVPVDTITYTGFVNGETALDLNPQPTVLSHESGQPNIGTYLGNYYFPQGEPKGGGDEGEHEDNFVVFNPVTNPVFDGNYVLKYVPGNLTVNAANFGINNTEFDALGRPILSVADLVINFYPSFEPHQVNPVNINISLRGGDNGGQDGGNPFANIEPAAGGDGNNGNPNGLPNIEPAAGGNGGGGNSGKGDFACANAFLDGINCAAQ